MDATVAVPTAPGQDDRKAPPRYKVLYLDESGSRHPDHDKNRSGTPWFAMGGILVDEEREDVAKAEFAVFLDRWPQIRSPLHMTDVGSERKGFAWLGRVGDDVRSRFLADHRRFLTALPVAGVACVIDRAGYAARGYAAKHGEARWMMCRTAFDIVVERAAKVALRDRRRLKVVFEMAEPATNNLVKGYFRNLKTAGLEFDASNSSRYQPLPQEDFRRTLASIEGKTKDSRMLQVADAYLWAISKGKYVAQLDLWRRILEKQRTVNAQLPPSEAGVMGIKYYCFGGVPAAASMVAATA